MYGYCILSRGFTTLEEVKPQACRNKVCFGCYNQSINHLYSHKPYTTVQRRHTYTYNKYRIDINIYTVYTTKTWV